MPAQHGWQAYLYGWRQMIPWVVIAFSAVGTCEGNAGIIVAARAVARSREIICDNRG
jgi:hypothetical protein